MTNQEIMTALTDTEALAITAWGEARSYFDDGRWVPSPIQARLDVMSVIRNRWLKNPTQFGTTIKGVCHKPWAFSCWKPEGGHDNYNAVMTAARIVADGKPVEDATLKETLFIARGLVSGDILDSVKGATHYYANWMKEAPAWSFYDPATRQRPIPVAVERFNHRFYVGIK